LGWVSSPFKKISNQDFLDGALVGGCRVTQAEVKYHNAFSASAIVCQTIILFLKFYFDSGK
jgi:hypothetical protein